MAGQAKVDHRGYGTTAEVADYIRVHPGTLRNWRHKRKGPPFTGCGAGVRYAWAAVDDWMREHNST